jgi:glycine/D-amino acid oxidase-like deaminating enzyme
VIERPYWWDTVATPAGPVDDRPLASVDVAVIGAGYTGLAAARALARRGAAVAVLEKDHVGAGASARNGGQVLTGLRPSPQDLIRRHGERRARELFDASLEAIATLERIMTDESIACDYETTGHLHAAWKPAHFDGLREEQATLARTFGHRVELIGRADQASEIGSQKYHGVLLDPRSAGLNPAKYVHGLAAAAMRAGARIRVQSPVQHLIQHGRRWQLTLPSGTLDAAAVVVATDAYSSALTPFLQRRLLPVGSYAIATAPLDPAVAAGVLPRRRMAFDSKYFLYYFRLTPDQRLLFGGRAEFTTPTPDATRRSAGILRRAMVDVFPQLSGVAVEYAWGGRVAFTRDELPHAGESEALFYAVGYGGHGIALATALGDAIGRRVAGEPVSHPLVDDRLPRMPLGRGAIWFLPIVGAYYRARDWLG